MTQNESAEVSEERYEDPDEDEQGQDDGDVEAEGQDGQGEGRPGGRRRGGRGPRRGLRGEPIHPTDGKMTLALEFVQNVVEDMEMDCEVHLVKPAEGSPEEIHIEIVGRDSGRIIGKKGQVLGALQFLAHRVVNRPGEEKRHILVDAEGYRGRRDENLASMARKLGKQAVELGKIITFEPMNPRDRRVVHMALAKFEGVITKSDGEGDDRRVQIIPVRRA